jgi:glyceraldehyde-3-phosphate dehydrogenase (NADP+)
MSREYKFLINGEWRGSGEPVEIRSPYDRTVVGVTWMALPQDADDAVRAAETAFHETRKLPTYRRAEVLE